MTGQSARVGNRYAADDEFAPLSKRVYVKALAYAHGGIRQ